MTDSITADEFFFVANKKYEIDDFSKATEINPKDAGHIAIEDLQKIK